MRKLLAIFLCVAMICTLVACGKNEPEENHPPVDATQPVNPDQNVDTPNDGTVTDQPDASNPTDPTVETEPLIVNYEVPEVFTPWQNELYSGVQGRITDIYVDRGMLTKVDDVWCNSDRIWTIPEGNEIVTFDGRIMITKDEADLYVAYGYVGDELVGTEIDCPDDAGIVVDWSDTSSFMRVYHKDNIAYGEAYVLFEGIESAGKLMCYIDEDAIDIDLFCGEWMDRYLVVVDGVVMSVDQEFEVVDDALVFTNAKTEFSANATKYLGSDMNYDAFLLADDNTQIWCQHIDGDWFTIQMPNGYTTENIKGVTIENGSILIEFADGKYYWNGSLAIAEVGTTVELKDATSEIQGFADWQKSEKVKDVFAIGGELLVLMDDGIIYKVH